MSLQIIPAGSVNIVDKETSFNDLLEISEFFCDTIQGEGNVGYPAAFLRVQRCTLNCDWCDTKEVWRQGSPYSFPMLFDLMELPQFDLINKFRRGQRLVITGGSPLRQQLRIINFIYAFIERYKFSPYIEIENECVLRVGNDLAEVVDCWNNSPKLSNSGNPTLRRYKPEVIASTAKLVNSWFKFVITCEDDWNEIMYDFVDAQLIRLNQIILMPEGQTREEVMKNAPMVVDLAIKHNVRYTTREHVILWDKKTGV